MKGQKTTEGVFFGALLATRDDPEGREELKHLDDVTLAENMFLINAAAYDTTSTTLVWILKYLIDYPEVFRRCQVRSMLCFSVGIRHELSDIVELEFAVTRFWNAINDIILSKFMPMSTLNHHAGRYSIMCVTSDRQPSRPLNVEECGSQLLSGPFFSDLL